MCNHSSFDTDSQEEYSQLSVEKYSPQSIENHSPSSDDFDPHEEDSQMSVEEYSPQLVEDDSPLLNDSNPQQEYSSLLVEDYSSQSVEIYLSLSDEMSTEENTIEEYTPGTLEDDESQQSPRITINYTKCYIKFQEIASASKSIVVELNKEEKLNGDNYEMWHRKVQLILEEQEALETLSNTMDEPSNGNTAQHRRDMETYQTWKRNNSLARITMLSSMNDALMCEYEEFDTALGMWIALKDKFGGENSDGSVTKIESRDVNFLENEFPKRGEVDRDIRFYELDNLIEDSNLNAQLEVNADLLGSSVPSGSKTPLQVNIHLLGPSVSGGRNKVVETTLLDLPSRRSNRGNVPRRHFEIEKESFMVASHDADEPKMLMRLSNHPTRNYG
ncbi:hypothetical protein LWI28_024079 [Acer negundo]|uniref:Uncharacterized protein n=1 Tax=Acer negundo TaxID=4023 RepID=A0AAD5NRD6_ACENE|nr:hypothetical protein LWI28_024079 [Acer negundo]